MNGLILHCGAAIKTREEVFSVPIPEATTSYAPLPYESLVTRVEKQLAVEGIRVHEQHFALSKNGQRMFGLLGIEFPTRAHSDYRCVLGLRNSYDKSMSTGLCVGARVFVCDNLSFNGEVTFARKHTSNLLRDLSWIIAETVAQLPARSLAQSVKFEMYRATPLTDRDAHDLIIRMTDAEVINMADVRNVLKEWREPRHREFTLCGKNGWRLFNAATEVLRGDVWRLPARTTRLHQLLDAEFGSEQWTERVKRAEDTETAPVLN